MSIPEREKELLELWRTEQTFAKTAERRQGAPLYSFFDGPPFATGLPHYGHILASVAKDLVGRYWTMRGYQVPRRWGWDCHGLPIENIVEKELGISGKKQIEERGVELFNETCRRNVLTYAEDWGVMIERIARWVNFDGSYKTMDSTYMESVWWALKEFWKKGLVYQGRRSLLYCPRCETPVSNFEVAMDNSYQTVTDDTATVTFPLVSGDWQGAELLAWTTTPWTLPANVGIAVGPEIEYALVTKDNKKYVVAATLVESVLGEAKIEQVKRGEELVGWSYEPLFPGEAPFKIAAADFVTTESGTGLVHVATGYGEDDFQLGQREEWPVLIVLNEQGHYLDNVPEGLRGVYHKKGGKLVLEQLQETGRLFKSEPYTHEYPFCWRCSTPLYYSAIRAWFINIQDVKGRLLELNEQITWHPEHLKHGRFLKSVESAPDWNISRNRYWATALPFWVCDDGACAHTTCIGSLQELQEQAVNYDEVYSSRDIKEVDLHKPYIDAIKLRCERCNGQMTRVPEVLDCWFESGSMPFAELHYPFENQTEVEQRLPADFVSEYVAQTRAWFYYMHVVSTVLFDKAPFKHVVTTGTILNEKGEKMSKSKQNFPDPWEVIEKYGVDSLRLYLMSSVVMKGENLFFAEREVAELCRRVIQLWTNVVSFYQLYAGDDLPEVTTKPDHVLDRWMLARLQQFVTDTTSAYDGYDLTGGARLIRSFTEDLSTWYVRRSRDRFKEGDKQGLAVFRQVLRTAAQTIAPSLPFLAEHTWQVLGEESSVHLTDWPTVPALDESDRDLIKQMETVQKLASALLSRRMQAKLKVRQVLRTAVVNQPLSAELQSLLADEVNVQQVQADTDLASTREGALTHPVDTNLVVWLDIELDEELERLGLLRELTRAVAERRKAAGLRVGEPAEVAYRTDDVALTSLIEQYAAELTTAAGGEWQADDSLQDSDAIVVEDRPLHLRISAITRNN